MKTKRKKIFLLMLTMTFLCGCGKEVDYGTEYNFETDCQYSYLNNVNSWRKIQSDGTGKYILKDDFIYYCNPQKGEMSVLCDKANCLHDKETNGSRREECNAYAPIEQSLSYNYIQYYEGNVYYVSKDSLYRVSKDGRKKDKLFTTEDEISINDWMIHRGDFYFEMNPYYYGEDVENQVYQRCLLRSIPLSSKMEEENANIIYEGDDEHTVLSLGGLQAYQDYVTFLVSENENGFVYENYNDWINQISANYYLYNTKTKEKQIISVPDGYSKTTYIQSIAFLKDKMILSLYDNLEDSEYELPKYSIDYELKNQQLWLDKVEQGKYVHCYDDYIILSDANMQYEKDKSESFNLEIYGADGKKISEFVYPLKKMCFSGFGPDGVNLEIDDGKDSWKVYELNFDDVLNCQGEKVKLKCIAERKFGSIHTEE